MTIRSLNDNRDRLSIFRQPDGDIQVTIIHDGETYRENHLLGVRVGGCGSGHDIPRRIWSLLNELATEFEKFEDCKNEHDAYYKEMEDKK